MKRKENKSQLPLEEKFNKPFVDDDRLLHMAWSLSTYVGMDDCMPIYIIQ
jgi:hypothetical protein